MTDSSAFTADGGAAADIRRWCDHTKIPGRHPDLSDAPRS